MNKEEYIKSNFIKQDIGLKDSIYAYFTKDSNLYVELCSIADNDNITVVDKLFEYEVTDFEPKDPQGYGYKSVAGFGFSNKLNKRIQWDAKNNIIFDK